MDSLDSSTLSGSVYAIGNSHPSYYNEPWEIGDFPVSCQEFFGWDLEEHLSPTKQEKDYIPIRVYERKSASAICSHARSRINLRDKDQDVLRNATVLMNEKEEVLAKIVDKAVAKARHFAGNDVSVIRHEIAVQTDSVLDNANSLEGAIIAIQCALGSLFSQQVAHIVANVQVMSKDCSFLRYTIIATGLQATGTQPFESFSKDLFLKIVKTICMSKYQSHSILHV